MRTRIWLAGLAGLTATLLAGCDVLLSANPLAGLQPTAIPTAFVPATLPPGGAIHGRLWHDVCSIWGDLQPDVSPPPGCAADARGGYRANGALDAGESGIAGVVVGLGPGLCPAAPSMETTTNPDGSYQFGGLVAGSYCVSLDPLAGANSPILLPGGWTYPLGIDGLLTISVALASDEVSQQLDFGWDFELLPVPLGPLPTVTPQPSTTLSPTPSATPTLPATITPTRTATPASFADWKGEYFANRSLSGTPTLVRNDKNVDFDWGSGIPAPELPADNFSVRWTQELDFSKATYRFTLRVDDGVRLYVDGKKILDEWEDGSLREFTVEHKMNGDQDIVVEYYERSGEAVIELTWKKLSPTATPTPTNSPGPTATPTPTPTPTDTPAPTDTDTPVPTDTETPVPTDTDTPEPTAT